MATIGDVAKAAGVSRSTVSYALTGKRAISAKTRERIEAAIAELGFTPDAKARALATSQSMVLGLLVQFRDDEFAPAMLQYVLPISDTARELGYDILMVTEVDGAAAAARITASKQIDGLVLLNVQHDDPRLPVLRAQPLPSVLVGLPGDPTGLDVYDLDFEESARVLVDHLHGLGHREVMLVTPAVQVFERGGAYGWRFRDAALEQAALRGMTLHVHHGESRQPAVSENLHRVLDEHPGATGLIVHHDASVAALPAVLHDRSIGVPTDLSVVSLYARDFGQAFSLPYTAVESSPDELGRLAVQQLVRRIAAPERVGPPVVRFVAPRITNRGSTAESRTT